MAKAVSNFRYFNNIIYPLSFEGRYVNSNHIDEWSLLLQNFDNVVIIAPRKHSKSTTIYSYIMWQILRNTNKDLEIFYISFKKELAAYHLRNLKTLITRNPYFKELTDLTPAETVAKYTWDNYHKIIIEPEGILSFKRGRHPHIVVLDDVLSDPTTMLDLGVIMKINQRVYEDVMSLPKEKGCLKIIGTPQTSEDFFFKLKDNKRFGWGMYPAIISDSKKITLWEGMFNYERLQQIKEDIGEKAFMKEYMLQPVYTAEAFFREQQINSIIDSRLIPLTTLKTENEVVAGWDIGKKSHPSHFTVFEKLNDMYIQRFQIFLDNVDYTDQVDKVNNWVERYKINVCYFDNTRGELEGFLERNELNKSIFKPIVLSLRSKSRLATEFEKVVVNDKIRLLDDGRQKRQILNVTNDLDSVDTVEGHGDSFWSIAMCIGGGSVGRMVPLTVALDDRDTFGLKGTRRFGYA